MEKNAMNWNLDETGKLSISGEGKIPDYAGRQKYQTPWNECKEQIVEIVIQEGITEIGVNAFRECKNLKRVVLPKSLWKIHAYAFWNCTSLQHIESDRDDFIYYYDKRNDVQSDRLKDSLNSIRNRHRKQTKGTNVIFGMESFFKVPWCKERWGDFYIQDGELYLCFSDKADIQIPEGVRTLKKYAFSHVSAHSLVLPKSLEVIEDFAFYGAAIEKEIFVKEETFQMEPYALADVDTLLLSTPWKMKNLKLERANARVNRRKYNPEYIEKYTIGLAKNKRFGDFRKMKVVEQHTIFHRNGDVTKVRDNNYIDIGKKMLRKVKNGKLLICITCEENRLKSVKSFAWNGYYKIPVEYLMYPVKMEDETIDIWSDSFTYMEEEDILYAFSTSDGPLLKKEGVLRICPEGRSEEWFWYENGECQGGGYELDLLREWLTVHPEIIVDDEEENIQNKKYRMFVEV